MKERDGNRCGSQPEPEFVVVTNNGVERGSRGVESETSDDPGHEPFARHGEVFSAEPADPVTTANGRTPVRDHAPGRGREGRRAPTEPQPADVAITQSPEHNNGVVEISAEQYQALLAAQKKLTHERELAKARRKRYKAKHPEKVKEEKLKWAKGTQGRATKAAIQRRYRERH